MTALEIYRAQYEEQRTWYNEANAYYTGEDWYDKYMWAASYIFNLVTYDDALNKRFVKDILEVCKVILEDRNFDYIRDEKNYIKYVLVCQLLINYDWINWGTSIRGVWFERRTDSRYIVDELEWSDEKLHLIEKVPFTVDNLKALIKFLEE